MTAHSPNPPLAPHRADDPAPIIAREGWILVAAFALGSAALTALAAWLLGTPAAAPVAIIGIALTAWCIWFFRDPPRIAPTDPHAIICPADGKVVHVGRPSPTPSLLAELGLDPDAASAMTRISIFMNVFNVHVNRAPVSGIVERLIYRAGTFLNAVHDKASEYNERCALLIRQDDGRAIVCVQIAGLIARRIICKARERDRLIAGRRFGLIRFGSRVDVYFPPGFTPAVKVGDHVQAGTTILARASLRSPADPNSHHRDTETQRKTEVVTSGTR